MSRVLEHHRIPLGPQITLLYQRHESPKTPLSVDCCFRLGYADGEPGQIYALMKAFQGQYAPAWRPRLSLSPDWSQLSFSASPEYRRTLDEQWLQLFELEAALTDLDPLKQGLFQEQTLLQQATGRALELSFLRFAFAGTAYDRLPLGEQQDLESLGQEELLDAYMQLFMRAPVYLRLRDHLPLPQVLDRIRPLIGRQEHELYRSFPLQQELSGPREQTLRLKVEGAWLHLGFVLPGMDNPGWIYGPLLQAWLRDVWKAEAPSEQLQLIDIKWQPWQQASLLSFHLHSHQAAELQEHKHKLLQWLIQARQGYLTSRRLKTAQQQATQAWSEDNPPLYAQLDELLHGWGHGRQRLAQVSLNGLGQACSRYLNADHWVLQEVCSPSVSLRLHPDHRKDMPLLGFAPRPKAGGSLAGGRLQEITRLALSPDWSLWLVPHPALAQLEIGIWFASGSASDLVPGTTRLLLELLGQRFGELLTQQDERGAVRHSQSWLTGVSPDACFFKWATSSAELPQALRILQSLLQDLPLDQIKLQQLKAKWQARLQYLQLDPAWRAGEQFLLSGFANHPYAFSSEGSYLSLQQIGLDTFRARWRELRQSALAHPLLTGNLPAAITAELIGPALVDIQQSQGPTPSLPQARVRRGEILAAADPKGYRLEGQLFAEPLPLAQQPLLLLALQWTQDQLRSRYAIPLEVHSQTLRQGWYFSFAGLYGKDERHRWLIETRSVSEPIDMLKQRLLADLRRRQLQSADYWQELVHWLSLGGSPAGFGEREHQLLALRREDVEAFTTRYLTQDGDWLQVVFQGAETRAEAKRY